MQKVFDFGTERSSYVKIKPSYDADLAQIPTFDRSQMKSQDAHCLKRRLQMVQQSQKSVIYKSGFAKYQQFIPGLASAGRNDTASKIAKAAEKNLPAKR